MHSQVNQNEEQFEETTQLFLKLLQNPQNKEDILKRFETQINDGSFLIYLKKLMEQQNDVSLKLKPLIAVIFKELCNKKNNYMNDDQQQLQFLNFMIQTINDSNINFQIKIILADSLKLLCEQMNKAHIDFQFLTIITNLMQGNVNYSDFEGPIIISNIMLEVFTQETQSTLVINFINNVFNNSQYKQFLEQLDKLLLDQSLKNPSQISMYIFNDFLKNLIIYLNNNRMLFNIFSKTTFFQDILQIIENISEPQNFYFRSLYFKILRQIQKICCSLDSLEKSCQRKHFFLQQFSDYFFNIYCQYLQKSCSIDMQSQQYLKRMLNICIPMIKEEIWKDQLQNIIGSSFEIIILDKILPTEEELENPQEFVYYYFDCIDERKSKTEKNLIFALMEELVVKKPDFFEFLIKSLNYIVESSISGAEFNIDYMKYFNNNLSIFSVLRKNSNIIKAYLITLTNCAFQLGERVDLLEDIEECLKQILNIYLSNSQVEDREEILSLFCLFFIYSSDFIFFNNDSYYKKILHTFIDLLGQNDLPKILEMQLIFMLDKIIDEEKVQIFIKEKISNLTEILVNKVYKSETQEFYSLLRKLFQYCNIQIIENILENFLQQIITLIQTKSSNFILGNCLEVLKFLLKLNHTQNEESLFFKVDLYLKAFLEMIIQNKTDLFNEQLLEIFQIVLEKTKIYLECFDFFLENILLIQQNTQVQCEFFKIMILFINKFKDKFVMYNNNITQFIEIILTNISFDEIYTDQNILLLGYLFSLNFFSQDQTVRLYSICYKQLTSKDKQKQSTYIAACVFLKITQENYQGAQKFLKQNNIDIQNFFHQFAIILLDKIKVSLYFLDKWMNIPIKFLIQNSQDITNKLFDKFLINCLLLNLIQLNQTNLFAEQRDQILYILSEQFCKDPLYQSLKQIYDQEYDYDNISEIEEEQLQELEDIGANMGKFPDHTLQRLTNDLLNINITNNFDSFEQMRNLIAQLENQQDYINIYQNQLGEDFQKIIKSSKNLHVFGNDTNYSVRKFLKIKRIKNKQFLISNQSKDGNGSLSPKEKISSRFIFNQELKVMAEINIDLDYLQKNFVEQIKNSSEIELHQERVKHQKVIDRNLINEKEKQKLKKELKDDYFTSQSEVESQNENQVINRRPRNGLIAKESTISGDSRIEIENQENENQNNYKQQALKEFIKCLENQRRKMQK